EVADQTCGRAAALRGSDVPERIDGADIWPTIRSFWNPGDYAGDHSLTTRAAVWISGRSKRCLRQRCLLGNRHGRARRHSPVRHLASGFDEQARYCVRVVQCGLSRSVVCRKRDDGNPIRLFFGRAGRVWNCRAIGCGDDLLDTSKSTTKASLGRRRNSPAKTFPEQVRHLDEERAAVAAEARLELSGERIEAIACQVIIVANIKSRTGIWCVAEEKLAPGVR